MTDIQYSVVAFIDQRERTVVNQALQAVTALHDALALKKNSVFPFRMRPEMQSSNWKTKSVP